MTLDDLIKSAITARASGIPGTTAVVIPLLPLCSLNHTSPEKSVFPISELSAYEIEGDGEIIVLR